MDDQTPVTNNAPNTTPVAPMPQATNRTLMGVLSYLGILVLIPLLMAKDDPFVKFHIKQGLVVFALYIVVWVVMGMLFWRLFFIAQLFNLALLVLVIMGIVNVVQGKEKELPIVGSLAHSIPFLKKKATGLSARSLA
jgi:uncharacterized membrane protein